MSEDQIALMESSRSPAEWDAHARLLRGTDGAYPEVVGSG